MLTAESGRTEQATGEVRPHCGKISKKRTSGVWHSGLNAILLRRTLSLHDPTFQRDQSRAILPPIRVGWAAYLGNVGLDFDTKALKFRLGLSFAAGARDFRGMYRNPGA